MKRITKLSMLMAAAVITGSIATSGVAMAAEIPFGSSGAALDQELTVEEMLTYAIEDEYMAQGEYNAILDEYGAVNIYNNIVKAEKFHIEALTSFLVAKGLTVPVNDAETRVVLPESLQKSYEIGIEAEINNIKMYEQFLKEDLSADVRYVFENLMKASKNHLNAFENAVDGNIGSGNGTNAKMGQQNKDGSGLKGGNSGRTGLYQHLCNRNGTR